MDLKVTYGKQRKPSSVLLVDYFENTRPGFGERFDPGDPFYELVKPVFDSGDFTGKWKQNIVIYTHGKLPETRVMLIGLGNGEKVSPFQVKVSFGHALKKLQHLNVSEVATFIDKKCTVNKVRELVEFLVEATYLSQYRHPSYKKKDNDNPDASRKLINKLHFVLTHDVDENLIEKGIEAGKIIGSSINEVRDLINKPANHMTPTDLTHYARNLDKKYPVKCEIFDEPQIESMGMGGISSVSRGSKEPSFLIKCTYTPETPGDYQTVALVGKGVTFDSGGISLKPRDGMYRMKDDMAGAALVLGIVKIAALLEVPMKIIAIVPTCENLPGGDALKPGDIITAYDNSSVEVLDTDAEGRLILMDALGYAVKQKPDLIVDMATLTGACTIALGRYLIGGFTNHQPVMDLMKTSGDYIYERVWQLPLMGEYKLQLKSPFADIRNYGGREGGAITAAVFLSHFVKNVPWIHLDVAGVTWFDTATSLIPEGASGIGVRLVIDFLRRLSKEGKKLLEKEGQTLEEPVFKENEVSIAHDVHRSPHKYFFS